jgi:hypothetical protein
VEDRAGTGVAGRRGEGRCGAVAYGHTHLAINDDVAALLANEGAGPRLIPVPRVRALVRRGRFELGEDPVGTRDKRLLLGDCGDGAPAR